MTYYLTGGRIGIPTERTPIPRNGKVILTFIGEHADSVSYNAHFYPILGGRAELPAEAITPRAELVAHAHATHLRYDCGELGQVGREGELVAPTTGQDAVLAAIGELLSELVRRLAAAEEGLASLDAAIKRKPITFGGI